MPSPILSPTVPERSALLRFEAAYEQWRLAHAALAASELRLWTETLRGADRQARRQLGNDALALREAARAARQQMIALARQPPRQSGPT